MEERGSHPGLELQLTALEDRIAELRRKMSKAAGLAKIEDFGDIEELERRYKALEDQLCSLEREGPGSRQDRKAEIEKLADELTDTVEDFVMWIDSGHRPDRRPKGVRKS